MLLPGVVASQIVTPAYVGPLDLVPGAVVAYGQRALSAAKLGTALYTIREGGGNTTQSFNSDATTGDAPVAAITTFLNGANGFGTIWRDQSGNSNDVAQATAANQFKWNGALLGAKPGWICIGTSDPTNATQMFTAGSVTFPSGAYTVFAVMNATRSQEFCGVNGNTEIGNDYMLVATRGTTNNLTSVNVDVFTSAGTGDEAGGRAVTPFVNYANTDVIYDAAWTFGAGSIGINNVISALDGANDFHGPPTALSGVFAVGSDDAQGGGLFDGHLAELIVYNSLLSDANRLAIRQNMATFYGITLS